MVRWRHLTFTDTSWKSRSELAHAFEDGLIDAITSGRIYAVGTYSTLCGYSLCIDARAPESTKPKCKKCLKRIQKVPRKIPPSPVSGVRLITRCRVTY
jgi:hypothetical protein